MLTLFMVQLGGRPKGRLIEQHDIFFGVGNHVNELIVDINNHWPEVKINGTLTRTERLVKWIIMRLNWSNQVAKQRVPTV